MTSTDNLPQGLRQRKKHDTRQRILNSAMTLFSERGYDAVNVEEIAEAADVSARTFYHYFSAKDELVLRFHADDLDTIIENMRALPLEVSAIARLRRGFVDTRGTTDRNLLRTRHLIMNESPLLRGKLVERREMWARQLAATLIECGHYPNDHAAALFLTRCVMSATQTAVEADVEGPDGVGFGQHLREFFDALSGGFEASESR